MIIIDATLQRRSSVHAQNAQRFNHGQGFVIGHQWTNVVLILHDMLLPLRPMPLYSQSYGLEKGLSDMSEHDRVVDSLSNLHLKEYMGSHDSRDVVV